MILTLTLPLPSPAHSCAHSRNDQWSVVNGQWSAEPDAAARPTPGRHRRLGCPVALAQEPRTLHAQREPRSLFLLSGVLGLPEHVTREDLAVGDIERPLGDAVRAALASSHQQGCWVRGSGRVLDQTAWQPKLRIWVHESRRRRRRRGHARTPIYPKLATCLSRIRASNAIASARTTVPGRARRCELALARHPAGVPGLGSKNGPGWASRPHRAHHLRRSRIPPAHKLRAAGLPTPCRPNGRAPLARWRGRRESANS